MSFRNTFIFAIILALLGAYVYYFEIKKGEEKEKAKEQEEKIYSFEKDEIGEIGLVDSENSRNFIIKKDEKGNWYIKEPIETLADNSTIGSLLSSIEGLKRERVLEESANNLSPYGLENPRFTVILKKADGEEMPKLLVGKKAPVGNSIYIKKGDDQKILLVSSSITNALDKDLFKLREKHLALFETDDVEGLKIVSSNDIIELKKAENDWKIIKPIEAQGDKNKINSILNSIKNLRAYSIEVEKADDLKKYGFNAPQKRVLIKVRDEAQEKEIIFGSEAEEKKIYGMSSEFRPVYVVRGSILNDIKTDIKELRDKTAIPFDKASIESIELKEPV
jgi:hypothetical protein